MSSNNKKAKDRQPPFWLLSLDPAEAAGWAFFKEGVPQLWGIADGRKYRTWMNALEESCVRGVLDVTHETKECVVEEGFFQYGKQTFKGALTLGRRRGLAQAAAETCGIDKCTLIVPSTWQNGLGWRKGLNTKEWSLAYAKQRWGIGNITHDTADAICLGTYFIDNYQALA